MRNGFRPNVSALSLARVVPLSLLLAPSPGPARPAPPPFLAIEPVGPASVLLTITNAVTGELYELQSAPRIAPGPEWRLETAGGPGQTNFVVPVEPGQSLFFKGRLATDWDHDGVVNWQDARPNDAEVGRLTVTIENPLHGSIVR